MGSALSWRRTHWLATSRKKEFSSSHDGTSCRWVSSKSRRTSWITSVCWLLGTSVHNIHRFPRTDVPRSQHRGHRSKSLVRVGVIFLRGGDGAKDGQKLVGGEEWK